MPTDENPHAGTGSVVVDIGGDHGALIVRMPAELENVEVEIVPTGTDARPTNPHDHDHDHDLLHNHDHPHDHAPGRGTPAPPHVAVVARPTPNGSILHSLVYGSLLEGTYDLYVRPSGPVHLTATVVGGQVTEASW
jgi:ABC-type Zn2+ transport system substrate-binding protein/surface adhesin